MQFVVGIGILLFVCFPDSFQLVDPNNYVLVLLTKMHE